MKNQRKWRRKMPNTLVPELCITRNSEQGHGLKILMLCWEYPPNVVGGLSRHIYGLSVHMAKMGCEVHVITAGTDILPIFELMDGVRVHRVKPINEYDQNFLSWIGGLNLAMAFKAEKLAQETRFQLIHAHDWLVGAAAVSLKELLSIPLLTTIHATEHGRNNGINTEIQKFIHEKEQQLITESNQIIVCSDFMKEHLVSVFDVASDEIAVIPNGVEIPTATIEAPEMLPELLNKNYIFSVGRIVKEKGFQTVIEAAAIAKEKDYDYYFVIAGKGPMQEEYRRQIKERQLTSHISFVGYVTDDQRNALIAGSQLTVTPSLYEPFGIVALESLILAKPTIVSNTGGMKGIVKHLQTGLLMNPGDPESLLEQIQFLEDNPDKAKEIGLRGREIVLRLYGWNRIASETARTMEDTVIHLQINE
jgi:glycogen synthase